MGRAPGYAMRRERTGRGPWTPASLAAATPVDNVRRELIDGWVYVDGIAVDDPMAEVAGESGTTYHASAVMELIVQLLPARDLHVGHLLTAPMDVAFTDGRVLQPDVFWVPAADLGDRPIAVTPSLVCEVASPSTRAHDLLRKRRVYEADRVDSFWFVDVDAQRVEVYELDDGRYGDPTLRHPGDVVTPRPLPGVGVDVGLVLGTWRD